MKASCDFWPESCAPFVKQLNLIFYVKKEEKKIQNRKARRKKNFAPVGAHYFQFLQSGLPIVCIRVILM